MPLVLVTDNVEVQRKVMEIFPEAICDDGTQGTALKARAEGEDILLAIWATDTMSEQAWISSLALVCQCAKELSGLYSVLLGHDDGYRNTEFLDSLMENMTPDQKTPNSLDQFIELLREGTGIYENLKEDLVVVYQDADEDSDVPEQEIDDTPYVYCHRCGDEIPADCSECGCTEED